MEDDFQAELNLKIEANTPIIQIISYEWRRIEGYCVKASKRKESPRIIYWWNKADGIQIWDENAEPRSLVKYQEMPSALEVLKWYNETMPNNSILVMENVHLYYNAMQEQGIIDQIRKATRANSQTKKTLILAQPIPMLPIELEKDVYVMEIPLPGLKQLKTLIKEVNSELEQDNKSVQIDDLDAIAEAGLGLTEIEIKHTFKEIAIQRKKLTKEEIPFIIERKEQIIRKSGILEYIHPKNTMLDVGGMENLKKWLDLEKNAFELDAKIFGIDAPKGILLLGVPGCGKSLIAKAIGDSWQKPLLKFDLGKVFGGIVGESESNMRKALGIAKAVAPCILWIDEIEKGLSGVSSSDKLDSGVTARVFGTFLTWMQEKEEPVFVVATANNVKEIPMEFLRKGRFDEIFFVDLPGPKSRRAIWEIHIKKRMTGRYESQLFNYDTLVDMSQFYSGSEIEGAVNNGLLLAYSEEREVNDEDLLKSISEIYPLSKVRVDEINKLRIWAKVRARIASDESPEDLPESIAKDVPKLPQESARNPWVDEDDE